MLKLLQFIKECIKNDNLNINDIDFDTLLLQTDDVFNSIMETSSTKRIPLIYLYSNKFFTDENNKYKDDIVNYFKDRDLNDFQMKYGCLVAGNKDVLKLPLEKLIELLSIIISSEEEYQAKYASSLATIQEVIFNPNSFDIIEYITKSRGEVQAINACEIAIRLLKRPDVKDIVKQLSLANYDYQAREACLVTICKEIAEIPNLLEIIKAIVKSHGEKQALYAALATMSEKVYIRDDATKLIDLLAKAKGEIQAKCGYTALSDDYIITLENLVPAISLLTNAKEGFQATSGLMTFQKIASLSETPEKLMLPVTKAKEFFQSFYANRAITDETLENPNLVKAIERLIESHNEVQAEYIYKLIQNPEFLSREDAPLIITFITKLEKEHQVIEMYKKIINKINRQDNSLETFQSIQIMMNTKKSQFSTFRLYKSKFTSEYKFYDFVDALENNNEEEETIKQFIKRKHSN